MSEKTEEVSRLMKLRESRSRVCILALMILGVEASVYFLRYDLFPSEALRLLGG